MRTNTQDRSLKFAYFILGIALPVAGYLVWSKSNGFRFQTRKQDVDEVRDLTLEDSFPASDPPSTW